jgi:hypothetical protein
MMHYAVLAVVLGVGGIALGQQAPVFYSYVADSGRTVYVNRFSMVPPEKRSEARAVDLSAVSLNEDLAEELADAVEDELRELKDSDPCMEARRERSQGAWSHVWHRHGPWILASLAALVLVSMSPWMALRTPPGVWPRLLMVALPALAMTALLALSATRATRSLEAVDELARLCDANQEEASPQARLLRLHEMHTYMEKLYKDQYEQIESMTKIQ